jgi:hypothetical protein
MRNPASMSRIAPPAKNKPTLAWLAAARISATTRFCSGLRWLSSMYV